jgi:DNA repair protein RecO (recombination protein O)
MTYRTQAIVLRSYAWPRHARCFVLYTREQGKVKAVAAGVQKIKSKVAGHLQPFTVSEIMLARGRTMDRLAQARMEQSFPSLGREYPLFLLGSYVLEVVERLTKEGVTDRFVWDEMLAVFQELDDQGQWSSGVSSREEQSRFALMTRLFALRILDRFGYRPELHACVACAQAIRPEQIYFSVLQGGVLCADCFHKQIEGQPVTPACVKLLREALLRPIASAARLLVSSQDAQLTMTLIDQMLSVQLQEPLRTSRLITAVQAQGIFV